MDDSCGEDMAGKAQHIWAMLNEMANSDPAAYRKFIDKNINDGKEYMALPEPHMCVQTSFQKRDNNRVILFINICEWKRIPAPKTQVDPIPIIGGPIYDLRDDIAGTKAICVAFNPDVLKECGRDAAMTEEQGLLIRLCLDYIDAQHNLKVNRSYSVLPYKVTHKGTLVALKKCLRSHTQKEDEVVESELEKAFGSTMKDSMLGEISNMLDNDGEVSHPIGTGTMNKTPTLQTSLRSTQNIHIVPPVKPAKPLIEEVRPDGGESDAAQLPKPDYDLTVKDVDETHPRRLLLRIRLPDVSSVAECELDIAVDDVHLVVADRYDLTVTFPEKVDCDTASAKFSTKTGTLTITLPITPP